ncbi:GTPase activating protein [Clydaea vesicula]|uniref:GTPase activating protein n=1 Tax=Clydaea vesicula TaxID=447962 RepID=A0AAD5U8I0_9FUNG|nr:GTPase activating protein [Clydaea vesicula]
MNEVQLLNIDGDEVESEPTKLLFVKTGVCLRAENDEMEVMEGIFCLLEKDASQSHYQFSWLPVTSTSPETKQLYQEVAKRTKNAILLNRSATNSVSNSKLQKSTPESINIDISSISHLVIDTELTLDEKFNSICLTRLIFYLKDESHSPKDPRNYNFGKGEVTELSDEEQAINSLGGLRFSPFWFEKEKLTTKGVVNSYDKYPTFNELDLKNSNQISSVYYIVKHTPQPVNTAQLASKQSLLSMAENFGSFGLGIVGKFAGFQTADQLSHTFEDATFEVLNSFSALTRLTKATGSTVLEHPLARPVLTYLPSNIRDFFMTSEEAGRLLDEYEGARDYLKILANEVGFIKQEKKVAIKKKDSTYLLDKSRDYEKLKFFLVDSSQKTLILEGTKPISVEEWINFYDHKSGKLKFDKDYFKNIIFARGVELDAKPEVWKFLLKFYEWDSTESSRLESLARKKQEFESLSRHWKTILEDAANLEPVPSLGNGEGGDENEDGDVVGKLKERKYRVEKDVVRTDRDLSFFSSNGPVSPRLEVNNLDNTTSSFQGNKSSESLENSLESQVARIPLNKNLESLRNILVTYTVYNFEIGYVQGMNDLLAPLLVILREEVDAFWCFVNFMDEMKPNFYRDQSGMRKQLKTLGILIRFMDPFLYTHFEATDSLNLFCCFRWMLVLFKREFAFDDIIKLWEALWSCPFTKNLHIFVAFAILNKNRHNFFNKCTAFDETLKYINDLSGIMDVEDILKRSEILFLVFKLKITKAAKIRLDLDLNSNTGNKIFSTKSNSKEDLAANTSDSEKGKTEVTWADPIERFNLAEISDEELWLLVQLIETE